MLRFNFGTSLANTDATLKLMMSRVFLFICLLMPSLTFAQKKIKFIHADDFKGSVINGVRFERAVGNVEFQQNTTNIKCDSSHFFRSENRLEAFGHVHITDDSVDITSLRLEYDGNTKIARLRQHVVFEKTGKAKLFTDFLDYDRIKDEARYFNGGKLVDTTNTLNSKKGYYDL